MTMAGIKPCPFNNIVISGIRSLLKLYCDRYKFEDHSAAGGRRVLLPHFRSFWCRERKKIERLILSDLRLLLVGIIEFVITLVLVA
jgi:hypothetical protein